MRDDLAAKLESQFPKLFDRKKSQKKKGPYGYWGLECGDGWYAIIEEMARKVTATVAEARLEQPVILQVKEKFGELRVYLAPMVPAVVRTVDRAQNASRNVCESCSGPGSVRNHEGWLSTMCDACKETRRKTAR